MQESDISIRLVYDPKYVWLCRYFQSFHVGWLGS